MKRFTIHGADQILDTNCRTKIEFLKKAQEFLNLPKSLFECDVERRNPDLYKGPKGVATIRRSKKAIVLMKGIEKNLNKIINLLS